MNLKALIPSCLIACSTVISAFAANPAGVGSEAAREQLKQFDVYEGLEVTLFASEPMIVNPANMDIDHRGRVWITEGANYRVWNKWGKQRPDGDRIRILEDTDGDGAADLAKTFYQGNDINTALGICVLGNKVIVSCSPNVFVFTDTDGDDKADKKEILFSGIEGVDHDHGIHAFVFGPDGKLYFNHGNEGKQIRDSNGRPIIDLDGNEIAQYRKPYQQGMVYRCNPDGTDVEVLAWNFRNNYEVAVDSFGTLWQSDNDDDGNRGVRINYVMEFGNYGYCDEMTGAGWRTERTNMEIEIPRRHWHLNDPGVVPNLLQTGAGSPTGMTIYEGELLPEVFRNQMIHADAGPRVVRAYPVETDGAGYEAEIVNLLTSKDTWFRPSDVCVAPDGSIYVADWNDAGVGGHHMADQQLATMSGRVYRIAPPGNRPSVPNYDFSTPESCVEALKSPNLATRYLAWTHLHDMGRQAEPALRELWRASNPRFQARALQLLARINPDDSRYLDQALESPNPDLRLTALRIIRELKEDLIPAVAKLANDPSPAVRRECAIALRHNESPKAAQLWAELSARYDGRDRWYLEALGIGADKQWDTFLDAWLEKVGSNWNTPAGRDILWRSRAKTTPHYLVKIIADENTQNKDRYLRALDFLSGPEKDAALVELLSVQ